MCYHSNACETLGDHVHWFFVCWLSYFVGHAVHWFLLVGLFCVSDSKAVVGKEKDQF